MKRPIFRCRSVIAPDNSVKNVVNSMSIIGTGCVDITYVSIIGSLRYLFQDQAQGGQTAGCKFQGGGGGGGGTQ